MPPKISTSSELGIKAAKTLMSELAVADKAAKYPRYQERKSELMTAVPTDMQFFNYQ